MKRYLKTPLLLLLCLTLALSGAMPVSAAIQTARKHQTPSVSNTQAIYAIDQTNQTYHPVPRDDWHRVRNGLTLSTTPSQNENKNSKYVGGFCFVLQDGTQRVYTISETQVLVGDVPLFASVAERASLAKLSKQLCKDNPAYPAMLAYMNPEKITRATLDGYGVTNNKIDTGKPIAMDITRAANPNAILDFANRLKALDVTPNATAIVNAHRLPAATDETMEASITFSTGTVYTLRITNGQLSIFSSDGTRTYTYDFPDYDPRRPGVGEGWDLRADLWELYRDGGNYTAAAIFLTKPINGERTRGAFYSIDDGGLTTVTRLGQILDDIRTATPLSRIQQSEKSYLEIRAENSDGEVELFELDGDNLTAYYLDGNGRGHSVPLSNDDYVWVKSLLNGRERSNRTILMEDTDNSVSRIYTCSSRDPLFGDLFDAKPKDPDASPYTTGTKPSYAKRGINCWADNGSLTETTVYYSGVMVQQSHLLPWTPAKYDAKTLYTQVRFLLDRTVKCGVTP